jgi:hypothetical protein
MRDDGGYVACRLNKHRRCTGPALRHQRWHPYGAEGGWLNGGLTGLAVRHGQTDDATDRLTRPAAAEK